MGGKTQKHTAKELAAKAKAAKMKGGGAGGGGSGLASRLNKTLKIMVFCNICKTQQPSVKSMKIHYDSKHPKVDWAEARAGYEEQFGEIFADVRAPSGGKKKGKKGGAKADAAAAAPVEAAPKKTKEQLAKEAKK